MQTVSFQPDTIERQWVVVDLEGQPLGRAASRIATILRGKHKPTFTPHADCGDFVIVVNADKVRLTGNKWEQKTYYRHTGYFGGIRSNTAKELLEKYPTRLISSAVKGMLPRGPLGRQMFTKLKVYASPEHPHAAQNPTAIELSSI